MQRYLAHRVLRLSQVFGVSLKLTLILFLVMLLAYSAGQLLSKKNVFNDIEQVVEYSLCDPTENICEINNSNGSYLLQFSGQPSALVAFDVMLNVNVDSKQPDSVEMYFDMPEMDMGYNQYKLFKNEKNWQAKVILPICSLGKNDWELNVRIRFENEVSTTNFKFSQAQKKQ